MNFRSNTSVPQDLLLLLLPIPMIGAFLCTLLYGMVSAIPAPSASAWLTELTAATVLALAGAVLLFIAKLPQYRAGIFWHFGSRRLPLFQQKLYRAAYFLIIPGCLALFILLAVASRVR